MENKIKVRLLNYHIINWVKDSCLKNLLIN